MTAHVWLDQASVAREVERLGSEIARDHPDGVVLVGVLKGALIFLADLARAVSGPDVAIDFIAISRFAPDSGRVRIVHDVSLDLTGRDVVLVEDIVDTGLTLGFLVAHLRNRNPRRVSVCTLFDRPERRIVPEPVHYCGATLRDEFVLGYGLHFHDLYRNLPVVAIGERSHVLEAEDCYVESLYDTNDSP